MPFRTNKGNNSERQWKYSAAPRSEIILCECARVKSKQLYASPRLASSFKPPEEIYSTPAPDWGWLFHRVPSTWKLKQVLAPQNEHVPIKRVGVMLRNQNPERKMQAALPFALSIRWLSRCICQVPKSCEMVILSSAKGFYRGNRIGSMGGLLKISVALVNGTHPI